MNISCLQENLSSALSLVRSGIGKESGLPILSTILIRTEGKLIYLNATNLEIAIQCGVRGKVEEEGSIAIPAKTLSDFISLLPKEKIELKTEGDATLFISCGTYTTKINGILPDEFPLIPFPESGKTFQCMQKDIKNALLSAAQAAAQQETRPELHGVYLSWGGTRKNAVCVGTDAYRLSEMSFSVTNNNQEDSACIIPLRTAQELSRSILADDDVLCEVGMTETQVYVKTENVECISKIVQGAFPDYHSIIPQQFHTKALIGREELGRAVKASSLFSRGGLNDIVCKFIPADDTRGTVVLSSANASVGENTVALQAEMTGGENSITVNYRYLLDGLSHMSSDTVSFGVVDTQSPCVVRPAGKDTFTYLIMPIRE